MAISYNLYYDKLSRDLKVAAKKHGLSEQHLEQLAAKKHWSFQEFKNRMVALKKGLIAGDVKNLSYPLQLGGKSKVKAAIYLANRNGDRFVIEKIRKLKAAGII